MTPIATKGYQPCGAAATSCSFYDNAGVTSVSNTFKSFTSYLIPTLVPAAGLVYYVALANVDATTQIAAYQIATITIMP